MCNQRGMPLPFANGVNMYAMSSPLVTNWIGEDGFLKQHEGRLKKPLYYGDVLWFTGDIDTLSAVDGNTEVSIEWTALNQDEDPVLEGESTVLLPTA